MSKKKKQKQKQWTWKRRSRRIVDMTVGDVCNWVDRTYREGGIFQWAREAVCNSMEAGATEVRLECERVAARLHHVGRRVIADNGCGMDQDDLRNYMNSLSSSSKNMGGVHGHFGMGLRVSLLPWNPEGIVIISKTEGGEVLMVQLVRSDDRYGLREWVIGDEDGDDDAILDVVTPGYDAQYDIDWSEVADPYFGSGSAVKGKPWKSGTLIVLLGRAPEHDTMFGDPGRPEDEQLALLKYLNGRFWEMSKGPEKDCVVTVQYYWNKDTGTWNWSDLNKKGKNGKRSMSTHNAYGRKSWLEGHKEKSDLGTLLHPDGSKIHWFLRQKNDVPDTKTHVRHHRHGDVAILYDGEIYESTLYVPNTSNQKHSRFGCSQKGVWERVSIVIEPPKHGKKRSGIHPDGSGRKALKWSEAGQSVSYDPPWDDWATFFRDNMPDPIRKVVSEFFSDSESSEFGKKWAERMMSKYSSRMKIPKRKVMVSSNGSEAVCVIDGTGGGGVSGNGNGKPRKEGGGGGGGGGGGSGKDPQRKGPGRPASGTSSGRKIKGGIPEPKFVDEDPKEDGTIDKGFAAKWEPASAANKNRDFVIVNIRHPVIVRAVDYWAQFIPPDLMDAAKKIIWEVYGLSLALKISHIDHLEGYVSPSDREEMRSPRSLTAAILGFMGEEVVFEKRLREARLLPPIGSRSKSKKGGA